MRVKIPYGNSYLEHDFGANCRVVHSKIAEMKPDGAGEEIVRKAMAHPISSQTLRELAVGKQNAVIIISDHTRPVPSKKIIPFMLQELREGSPDIDITLLVATGCHRETEVRELREKLGEEILQKEKIVIHNCDSEDMVNLGKLPSGAELVINRRAADCDLLLAEGFIEPHFFAGFSGGRKSILPGICSRRTVLGNHCSTFIASENARMGVLYGNPIHADMIDAVKKARLAYIVNVVIDPEKNVVAAFAGDAIEAHAEGCRFLKNYCCVPVGEKADIVVTSNGGAPLDQNVYQAVKGMTTAESFCRQGGVIIMCAECADGIGGELLLQKNGGLPHAGGIGSGNSGDPDGRDHSRSMAVSDTGAHYEKASCHSGMRRKEPDGRSGDENGICGRFGRSHAKSGFCTRKYRSRLDHSDSGWRIRDWHLERSIDADHTTVPQLFHQHDTFDSVNLHDIDGDQFGFCRRHVFADVVGADWKLAVSAIDQHRELDGSRAAVSGCRIQSRAGSPSGIENIIDEDDIFPVDIKVDVARMNDRIRLNFGQIVAIERNIQFADRNRDALNGENIFGKALRERQSAAFHTEQDKIICTVVTFNDLM